MQATAIAGETQMHLSMLVPSSRTSRRATRRGCRTALVKCICVPPAIAVNAGCDSHDRLASDSERELATQCVLECLQAAEGDEFRNVLLASEGGEHAREIGG